MVFKKPTYNYTRNPKRRFEFSIGVGGDEDLIEVHEIGLDTLRSTPGVLEKPTPEVHVDGIGDSAVNVSFSGWLDQREHDWRKVRGEAIRRVKSRLDAGGIDMPEPIYRIRTSRMDDEVSSDQERRERAEQQLDEPGLDVGADTEIDSQIEVEREESGEQDLLEE